MMMMLDDGDDDDYNVYMSMCRKQGRVKSVGMGSVRGVTGQYVCKF